MLCIPLSATDPPSQSQYHPSDSALILARSYRSAQRDLGHTHTHTLVVNTLHKPSSEHVSHKYAVALVCADSSTLPRFL